MPYKGLASLKIGDSCLRAWAEDLNPSTGRSYAYRLLRYSEWARGKGYWLSATVMLDEYKGLREEARFKHTDIVKQYLKEHGTGAKDRHQIWSAIKSFYEYYRHPLPELPRNEIARIFRLSDEDKRRAMEMPTLRLEDMRRLIINAPQPYKAVFTVMFQGAMGLAEFSQFNISGWRKLGSLDEPGPLRIDLYRMKTSREEVKKYYTFIGEDGKAAIREWLAQRPKIEDDALFVSFNKTTGKWVPVRDITITKAITNTAKRCGLIKPNGLKRYHVHTHEFRDLFKSLCTLNGVASVASEFFLGHTIDKLGYDKSPQYDNEWFKAQYTKVEPKLNILSNPSGEDVAKRIEDYKKEAVVEAIRSFAQAFGIDPMRVRVEKQKTLGREPSGEEEIQAIQNEIKKMRAREDDPQTIVDEKDLESYLGDGWQFVSVLPSRKIIIRK